MTTTYKTLAKFLASINLTEQRLKSLTGIPIRRLRAIYRAGDFTDDELIKLIKALSARTAIKLAYAAQIGDFNQQGIGNTQTFITNIFNITMRRLSTPAPAQPHVLPVTPMLATSVQQATGQLPGSQVTHINSSLEAASPWALVA
jgi:hypothetical protein